MRFSEFLGCLRCLQRIVIVVFKLLLQQLLACAGGGGGGGGGGDGGDGFCSDCGGGDFRPPILPLFFIMSV